jgi:NADH-quinone oxidoreductase subunit J
MVLFLFVIMLLNLKRDPARERGKMTRRTLGVILVLAFIVELGALFFAATANNGVSSAVPNAGSIVGSTQVIGKSLFTTYLFPFEVASILLLVGMVGAIVLAKRKLD